MIGLITAAAWRATSAARRLPLRTGPASMAGRAELGS